MSERPLRKILRPDPWGKTLRGRVYFGTLDARRATADRWRRFARVVDRWINP